MLSSDRRKTGTSPLPVSELLRNARALLNPARFEPKSSSRRFNIGASDYAAVTTVPGLVRCLREAAPNATIEIVPIGERVLSQLEAGELDIAFFGADPPSAPYLSRELFRERYVGLLCARHPLALKAGQGQLTLDDYLAYPHVMVSFRDRRASPVDAALNILGRQRRVAVMTPNFASSVTSLVGTDLLMSMPSRLVASASGLNLVRFALPLAVPDYPYSMIWHRRTDLDPACIWLRSQVADGEA